MMKSRLTLTLALLLICTGAALAQTPDGETPADETVCDGETGAAFGLCNAYCEAMDCESDDPQASATACTKVRNKYQNITGHDLPCEQPAVTCPCQSIPEFNSFLASVNFCYEDVNPDTVLLTEESISFGIPVEIVGSVGPSEAGPTACVYSNPSTETEFLLVITPEQAAACIELLHAAAASRGVTCQPLSGGAG